MVAVPPSRRRPFQPVREIAKALGATLSTPVLTNAVTKARETPELKDVFDFGERQRLLANAFSVNAKVIAGRRLLLIDDLYRSGATAAVVAGELAAAGAATVYFLAMTKTRTRS